MTGFANKETLLKGKETLLKGKDTLLKRTQKGFAKKGTLLKRKAANVRERTQPFGMSLR